MRSDTIILPGHDPKGLARTIVTGWPVDVTTFSVSLKKEYDPIEGEVVETVLAIYLTLDVPELYKEFWGEDTAAYQKFTSKPMEEKLEVVVRDSESNGWFATITNQNAYYYEQDPEDSSKKKRHYLYHVPDVRKNDRIEEIMQGVAIFARWHATHHWSKLISYKSRTGNEWERSCSNCKYCVRLVNDDEHGDIPSRSVTDMVDHGQYQPKHICWFDGKYVDMGAVKFLNSVARTDGGRIHMFKNWLESDTPGAKKRKSPVERIFEGFLRDEAHECKNHHWGYKKDNGEWYEEKADPIRMRMVWNFSKPGERILTCVLVPSFRIEFAPDCLFQ